MISQEEMLDEALRLVGLKEVTNKILVRRNAVLEAKLAKRDAEELLQTLTEDDLQSNVCENEG